MEFRRLAELCELLSKMRERSKMVDIVATFLRELRPSEVEPAVLMISGRPFPRWSAKSLDISWATLSDVVLRVVGSEREELERAFDATGDLGEAAEVVFTSRPKRQATLIETPLTLGEVIRIFNRIAAVKGEGARERKEAILEGLLSRATPLEAKYLIKIIIGEMRTGFREGLMELAVSRAFGVRPEAIERATMFCGEIADVAKVAATEGEKGVLAIGPEIFRPTQPMLAQNVESIEEAIALHGGNTAFEYKLDGARVQVHKRGDEVRVFSRRLSDVTEGLPEVVDVVKEGVKARQAILEGEVVALGKGNMPLPFQYLMQRFRRERDIEAMMREIPVSLTLFDVLYYDGHSLIDVGYSDRRKKLCELAGEIPVVQQLVTGNASEARKFLEESLRAGHEGLIAKKLDSTYTPGARGKLWLKIKPVLEPLDLVIVAAEYGYGRRHKWLSDYYLAARDETTGEFLVVGKTFKGLTDREIAEMTERLKELTIKREGRRVLVTPKVVVEVAYNEIQRSPKYKCGMALRFARITRIRDDKGPEDADTIQRVREIFRKQVKGHEQCLESDGDASAIF
ncbi:MAG: ATP-dependent DNA ligase [Candidatus Hadarchaeales archaeon]